MKIYKVSQSSEINYLNIADTDEFGLDSFLVYDAVDYLERNSGINILRGKEVSTIAMSGEKVVGALWDEFDGENYSFDVAVLPEYRRMGIAKNLIGDALSNYSMYQELGAKIILDVVNVDLANYLQKIGFEVIEEFDGRKIMSMSS